MTARAIDIADQGTDAIYVTTKDGSWNSATRRDRDRHIRGARPDESLRSASFPPAQPWA